MIPERLLAQLKIDEGIEEYMYDDITGRRVTTRLPSGGHHTIGVGFNLLTEPMPEAVMDLWLRILVERVIKELDKSKPVWRRHNSLRQEVLANMCYNLGLPKLLEFRRMWAALSVGNYEQAADEMLDSAWAIQVGARARRLAQIMRDG